jgi:hypothetical protein
MKIVHYTDGDGTERQIVEAQAFDANFRPAEVTCDVRPDDCDHAGQMWSSDLDVCCRHCGAPLFLPPSVLAHMPIETINSMCALWCAAGYPPFLAGRWLIEADYWTILEHPLFAHLGGLPWSNDRLDDAPASGDIDDQINGMDLK